MTTVLARTAIGQFDNALTALVRGADGAIGIESLGINAFQRYAGSLEGAVAHGEALATSQFDEIMRGMMSDTGGVYIVAHEGGEVLTSNAFLTRTSAIRGSDLVGSAVSPNGVPQILSHHPSVVGVVAEGRWFRLGG